MRFCKDCKYSKPLTDGKYDAFTSCLHPDLVRVNPVTGEKEGPSALMVRADGRCGSESIKWEAKS